MRHILILLTLFLFSCASVKVAPTEKRAKKQLHKTVATYNAITSAYPQLKEVSKKQVAAAIPKVKAAEQVTIWYDTTQYDTSISELKTLIAQRDKLISELEMSDSDRTAINLLHSKAANKIAELQLQITQPKSLNYTDDFLDFGLVIQDGAIIWVEYEIKERTSNIEVDHDIVSVDSGIRKSLSAEIFSLILLAALFIAIAFILYRFSIYLRTK